MPKANVKEFNYKTIDRPYNNDLERVAVGIAEGVPIESGVGGTPAGVGMGRIESAGQMSGGIIEGQSLENIWIDSWIKSRNYKPKSTGFYIDGKTGHIEAMSLYIKGEIVGGSLDIPDKVADDSFHVNSVGNTWWGANYADGYSVADAYVLNTGVVKFQSGTIGGCVLASDSIGSTSFSSGPLGNGWQITNDGTAEFQNATIRGIIRTSVFEKDTISAVNGIVLISKADVLETDMTALDASTLEITGETTFDHTNNEVIRIKDGTNDEWMLVTGKSGNVYTVTRDLAGSYTGDVNPVWKKGTAVVSVGVGAGTKTGFILLDSSSDNSPYIDVYGRNSNTYTDYTLHGRFGWLKGIVDADVGLNNTDVWGLYTDNAYIKGTVYATGGYFGDSTNGISIAANGLEIVGTGYIRTSSTNPKIEMLATGGEGGLDNVLQIWDTNDSLRLRLADGTRPIYAIGTDVYGCAYFVNSSNTCGSGQLDISLQGLQDGINITVTGTTARSAKAALYIDNSSTYGMGIYAAHGENSVDALVSLASNIKLANLIEIAATSLTAVQAARITNKNYLQFPARYHCSEFDENIADGTALAGSVIANAYWDVGGTNGTQTFQTGTNEDANSYILLETSATANSDSYMQFGRFLATEDQACIEMRILTANNTNTAIKFGLYKDATHYAYFLFDTGVDAGNIYAETKNGGAATQTDTGNNINTSLWYTYRIQIFGTKAYFYMDDFLKVTIDTNVPSGTHMKPYIYVDNKAETENKKVYVDYVKMWTGRDWTSGVN